MKIAFLKKTNSKQNQKKPKTNSKPPKFFPVKFFVCFKVPEISSNFSGPFVTDCQNGARLNLCGILGQAEPALRLLFNFYLVLQV